MSMLPPVFATLKASQAVKDIVGTSPPRIFRHGDVPQDTERPFIAWHLVSGIPENTLSELPVMDRFTVEVNCYHQTDKGVELLAEAVRDAIEPHAHMTGIVVNLREEHTKLFRLGMQFDFLLNRN